MKDIDRVAVDFLDEFRGMWIAEGLETGGEFREDGEEGSWEEMFATADQRRRLIIDGKERASYLYFVPWGSVVATTRTRSTTNQANHET